MSRRANDEGAHRNTVLGEVKAYHEYFMFSNVSINPSLILKLYMFFTIVENVIQA